MFTLPLSRSEYEELVDAKYGRDAAATSGWALYDGRGRIYGWHRQLAGSRQWALRDNAFAAFIPDTRRRQYLARIGHTVTATTGIEELSALLRRARGDAEDTERQDDEGRQR
jgi:hypothetical protein